MNKEKIASLLGLGTLVVALGAYGITHAQSILSQLQPKVVVMGNYIEAPGSQGAVQTEQRLGATASDPSNTTNWTGGGSFGGDLSTSGNFSATGSTTISYLVGAENTSYISFNSASTTVCAVQNTSGQDRVIDAFFLHFAAGTSANTVNASYRGYASTGRADNGTTATGTLFKQVVIVSSSQAIAYGGPVITSYYVSSTALLTGAGLTTTTPVMWYNNSYANVTSTAITSSTGSCVITFHPFLNQ